MLANAHRSDAVLTQEASWFLSWVEGRGVQSWAGGWLRWSAHPVHWVDCSRHSQYPAFASETLVLLLKPWFSPCLAPGSSEAAVGFLSYCILLSIIAPTGIYAVTFSPL